MEEEIGKKTPQRDTERDRHFTPSNLDVESLRGLQDEVPDLGVTRGKAEDADSTKEGETEMNPVRAISGEGPSNANQQAGLW